MSKRFNSLLFGALAALLLGAPVQAQDFATKARASKNVPVAKAIQPMKKADIYASKEFSKLTQQQQDVVKKNQEVSETKVTTVVNEPVKGLVERMPQMWLGKASKLQFSNEREVRTAPLKAPRLAADETINENGIIVAPAEGESKLYTREGGYYVNSDGQLYYGTQSGHVEIVECEDGTVYVKDIVSSFTPETWVKGVIEDNTLTINVGQPVFFSSSFGATLSIYWGGYDEDDNFYKDYDAETITFSIDGDVLTLQGSAENYFVGVFWDDDDTFSGYGDYETVWTLDADYVPATTDPVEAPEGLETASWFVQGLEYSDGSAIPFTRPITAGQDGDELYIQGLFSDFPESWIKGTVEGNTVTFKKFQFLGWYGEYPIWAVGFDGNTEQIVDCVMNIDEETGTLSLPNGLYFVANAAEDRLYFLQLFLTLEILDSIEEPEAETGDPIDELPYANSFNSEEEQAAFGTINANMDDKEWSLYDLSGDGDYGWRYLYNGKKAADDWLVSPAIYMEAGKNYRLAFDMVTGSYTERVEVLLGTGTKAADFTQTVIEAEEYATGGQFITLENELITVEESGYYHVGIHAISDADQYYIIVDNFLFEASAEPTAPDAVTDFTVESFQGTEVGATVTFTAPTTAINGTELTENIARIDLLRDEVVIKSFEDVAPGETIVYFDEDEALTAGNHTYQVIPYDENGVGKKSEVITVFLTQVLTVPFTADLTQQSVFETFQTIDANEDGKNWTWNSGYGTYAPYTSAEVQPDDYLVSLPVQLIAGKRYNVVVNARANSSVYSERFEVLVGTEPTAEAMTITAIGPTVPDYEADDYEGEFTVPENGNYYVAVHHISDPDQYYLIVNSLSVEPGLLDDAPAAPRLAVQPDPYGAEKAVVTVTAPGRDIMGAKLTKNIDFMNVYRDGQLIKSFENVAPQGIKVFVDDNVAGSHSYQTVCYDADGNRGKKSEKKTVYIGLDIPAPLAKVNAQELADGVKLSWKPVTTGFNGGIVVPGEIGYDVWTGHIEYLGGIFAVLVLDDVVATTNGTSVFVPYDATAPQSLETLYVLPHNEAGSPEDDYAAQVYFYVGTPYEMPFEEHFASSGFNYATWYADASDDIQIGSTSDASDEDGGSLTFLSYGDEDWSWVTAGKVKVGNGNPTLMVDFKGDADVNKLKIFVETPDGDVILEGSFGVTEDFTTANVSLAKYAALDYIKFRIYAEFNAEGSITIDNVRLIDLLEYNLIASIKAPKSVQAGNVAPVLINVKNMGQNAALGYAVKLFANDEEVYNETVNDALLPFKSSDFEISYATSIFDDAQDVTLRAEVEFELDLDEEDNAAETIISIKESPASQPENLVAEKTEDGVKLSWDAPANAADVVVEDFENQETFVPFSIGGIDADNRYGTLGDWTVYDGNNSTVYGFNGITFDNEFIIQAWQVAYPAAFGGEESYAAHSGDQFLWSFCPVNDAGTPAADHWLISPVLTGDAQTISFWYRAITDQYDEETFEVWYSTTDNQVESFEKIGDYSTLATEWTEMSVDLPAGALYFAIRHTSTDIFGLLIDDVTFATSGGAVSKYNVYVEKELYDDTTETSIEIANTTAKVFAVSAVYVTGAESKPVVVVLESGNQQITAIEQITGSKQPVDIYSLDGKLLRQQTNDLQGLKGAYIINGQKVILK